MRRPLLALALGLLALVPGRSRAQELPGTRSLFVLDVPFLHFGPADLDAPGRGRFAIGAALAYGNTFSHTWHPRAIHDELDGPGRAPFTRAEAEELHRRHPGDEIALLDAEVTRVALRAGVGLGGGVALSLEVPWISWGAISADTSVEWFHSTFGLHTFDRDLFPRGRFEVVQQRPFGALEFTDEVPRAGLGDVVGALRIARAPDPRTAWSAALVLKAPTGDPDAWRGSGSWDAGLLLSGRRALSRVVALQLDAGLVVPGPFRGSGATMETAPFARLLAALEVRGGARTTWSLAGVWEQSPQRRDAGRGDAARPSGEVTLGVARRLGEKVAASLAITENLSPYGDAADIAVLLGVRVLP